VTGGILDCCHERSRLKQTRQHSLEEEVTLRFGRSHSGFSLTFARHLLVSLQAEDAASSVTAAAKKVSEKVKNA